MNLAFENEFFRLSRNFISKMGVKMVFRILTKNHAADPEEDFLKKSISKPFGRATAMPPVWEINRKIPPLR